ncbi:MAG TPA: DUF4493 domain-containing protein [Candidatus Tidjanibacter gallistercoris]|nr:DUF4493 domain-containing protein [Candidatus Tidjanibacter gallistercoris]
MRRIWIAVAAAVVLCATGCSEGKEGLPAGGEGRVVFDCTVSAFVGTRADTRTLPSGTVPDEGALALVLSGAEGTAASYDAFADYDQPLLREGTYTAAFVYGNPDAEGPDAACFAGEGTFDVVARKTVTEPVAVSLANSVVSLAFTEWFRGYYTDFSLTVHTASGFRTGFVGSQISSSGETAPVFVKAGTELFLSGSATKSNGVEVSFPETLVGTTAARTWHTVTLDAGQAGRAGIVVTLDDTPVAVEEIPVELNPDA